MIAIDRVTVPDRVLNFSVSVGEHVKTATEKLVPLNHDIFTDGTGEEQLAYEDWVCIVLDY